MNSHHFIPLITKPTGFYTNSSHIPSSLDHIWANNVNNYDSGIRYILRPELTESPVIRFLRLKTEQKTKQIRCVSRL